MQKQISLNNKYNILSRIKSKKNNSGDNLSKKYYPAYLAAPALVIFTIFYICSILLGFYLAFTNWNIFSFDNFKFVGFENFKMLFTSQSFWVAIKNVFLFALVTTFFKVILGVLIALILNRKFRGRNFFRAAVFLPCTLGTLIIGYVFSFILQPDTGILNGFLRYIGLGSLALNWLGDPKVAIYSACMVDIWMWTGFNVAIILAALQSIPEELIEAAKIDGVNSWDKFKNITMPFIKPSINITVTLCIIGGFNIFDIIMSLTGGGPVGATEVISTLSYRALSVGTLGYAAAINLVQFLLITVIVTPVLTLLRKKEVDM